MSLADIIQQRFQTAPMACAVTINAHDARLRKGVAECGFQSLCAAPQGMQIHIAAVRTGAWHWTAMAAMMAAQTVVVR